MTTIAFIGGGNMARSIIGGLAQKAQFDMRAIIVSDPNEDSLHALTDDFGVSTTTNNQHAIAQADCVVLAVKPQALESVLSPLQAQLTVTQPLIISIAAGITIDSIRHWSGCRSIVRCMPNTPALYQQGASGLLANDQVNETQRQMANELISSVGITVWVTSESELDAVTAVSGSGPAYYFLFMEAMIQSGQKLGLSAEVAKKLTLQTALGAAHMANASEHSPTTLRTNVTSKGGTTEQAIQSFNQADLSAIVDQAMTAAFERSKTLSAELGKSGA